MAAGSAGMPPGTPAATLGAAGPDEDVAEEVGFGPTATGYGPAAELPSPRFDMPYVPPNTAGQARFGPGFQIRSPDDEFDIQFHNLTELDGRFYGIRNQTPVADTFDIARQWFVFNGHLTRPYEYYVSFNNAFDTFSALDVFLNVNYDKRIQFRFGRFKSPFTYEFWAQPTEALASGEWSVFFNNFGMNRDVGTMLWGESVADRIDYAAGIFNSTPNAQFDLSNPKSVIAFLNFAPFRPATGLAAGELQRGRLAGRGRSGPRARAPGAADDRADVRQQRDRRPVPDVQQQRGGLRPAQLLVAAYSVFLSEPDDPRRVGERLPGLCAGQRDDPRARAGRELLRASVVLPDRRDMASRGRVKPLRPFDLRPGRFGLGAWEVVFRYADLGLGRQVFTAGLADPNDWTNRLFVTDLGMNWYWNAYLHVLFDWQHAGFGRRCSTAPAASPGRATCSCSASRSGSERAGCPARLRIRRAA